MKKAVLLLSFLISTSAFSFAEIRCDNFRTGDDSKRIEVNLEFNWPSDRRYARTEMIVDTEDDFERYDFTATKDHFSRHYEIEYRGPDFYLVIDTWPDSHMRPLRKYEAEVRSSKLGEEGNVELDCAYWN